MHRDGEGGLRTIYVLFAVGLFFGAGLLVGSEYPSDRGPDAERSTAISSPDEKLGTLRDAGGHLSDRLRMSQAESVPVSYATSAEALADPRARAALEKTLRDVPYAVLKQVFLERQDAQWLRQQERYAQPKEMTDEELDQRADHLLEVFQRNAGDDFYYVSRGDIRLRGGKTLPYVELVEYYEAHSPGGEIPPSQVTKGKEVCYSATLYLRVGDKYASDGLSNCLSWVPVRKQHPFALHSNYNSKRLVPYFDTVSIALPGFGGDGDVNSEWYDAGSNRWTSLGKIRFDPVSREEFTAIVKETQLETEGD
jgi:hypothetical protein